MHLQYKKKIEEKLPTFLKWRVERANLSFN